ncbi:MAG: oligosaccharide flippase family protein [Planctomycetota bacterium]|nr:oligosaccharide flippase family protein [Planctomycetota bacterium]
MPIADASPQDPSGAPLRVPRRVWGAASWLIGGRLVSSSCTLLTLLALTGHLSDADFGRLTFWLAVFLVLDGVVDFGAGQISLQRAAADPAEAAPNLRTARRARVLSASAVVLTVAGVAATFEAGDGVYLALAALYHFSHVLELSTLGWKSRIAWRSPVLVRAGAAMASLLFVLVLRETGEDRPMPFLLAIAAGSTLGNVALHLAGRRGLPSVRGVRPAPIGGFLAASIPMGAAAVFQQLYFHVDNVFVRALEGDEAVGHYNVAVRIMSLAIMGGVFASSAALPWLARAHAEGRGLAAALRLAGASTALGLVVALGLVPLRETLLGLFGEGFLAASHSLLWLLAAAFAVHVGAPLMTAVVAAGRSQTLLAIASAGLAVNLLGNALLVPSRGMDGAAIATFMTEAVVAALALLALVKGARRVT